MKRRWPQSALVSAALFLLAVTVRAFSYRLVFGGDGISARGNDSFYHLRRIAYGVANFPDLLDFDRYINFPHGARPIWTPLLDGLLTLIAWPFARDLTPENLAPLGTLESIVVWVPPVMGGLTVVLLYLTSRARFGDSVATTAGLILCLLPAHVWYSQLGFVDHHVVVAAASWMAVMSGVHWIERDSPGGGYATWRIAAGAGAAFGATILAWPGGLYAVALVEIGILVYVLSRPDRAWAIRCAMQLALMNAVPLALVLPFASHADWPQWPPFSPVVLSEFQAWFFGVLLANAALWAGAWRVRAPDLRRRRISGCAIGAALLLASFLTIPGLREGSSEALRWLSRAEDFQAQVRESVPILSANGHFSIDWAVRYLSAFVLLLPAALAAAFFSAWRCRQRRASLLLLLWFASGLFAATLLQRRFANSFSLPAALLMAWTLVRVHRAIRTRWPEHRAARPLALLVACALAGALLAPAALFYQRTLRLEMALQRAGTGPLPAQVVRHRRMTEAALFLRDHTPPTRGWLDASAAPEYGVLGHWSLGHRIEYVARRPTLTDAFGDDIGRGNFQEAQNYFALAEPGAVELLQRLRVRYVIVGRDSRPPGAHIAPDSMFRSLYLRDGSEESTPGRRGRRQPALEQHRLLFETGPAPLTGPDGPSAFKIFEFVRGAIVSGRSAPGVSIRAALHLRSNRGRAILYSTTTRASSDGRFRLRLPYSTTHDPGLSRIDGPYSIGCAQEAIEVSVDESQVREGRLVRLPDLCRDALPDTGERAAPLGPLD